MISTALATDLYMLTVANGLFKENKWDQPATCYLFTRKAPYGGAYTIISGLQTLIHTLSNWHFSDPDIAYLQSLTYADGKARFEPAFLEQLKQLQFDADLYAVPEGTVVFPTSRSFVLKPH